MAEKKKEIGGRNLSVGAKIVIVVFAVMFALSLMLPSLASFLNSSSQKEAEKTEEVETSETTEETAEDDQSADAESTDEAADTSEDESKDESKDEKATDEAADDESKKDEEATDEEATDEEATKDEAESEDKADEEEKVDTSDVPNNDTLKTYAETYKPKVQRYEDRLKEDPDNLAAILNLGRTYMNWGYQADYVSTDTPEHDYSEKLIDEAIKAFDHYLELRDSKSVRSDRALCKYYKDDINGATADVEKLTEDYPDYALAWANLGMLYEGKAEDEKATEAYEKAVELDPDNVSGAKSFAGERIIAINSTVSSLADASDASADKLEKTEPSSTGLTDALKTDTGLGF